MNGSIQKNLRERLRCKRSSRFFITFLSLFCLIPTGFTQSPTPGPLDDLHPFLEMVRDDLNIPGIAVVVVGPETNMQIYTSGYCETDGSVPIDAHTRFHLASLTKTFNATLAAALVDEGLLSWDTRVKDVIPEFELSDPMASEHATLRDLLCHRVGIGRNSLPSFNRWESPEWWLPRLVHLPFESSFRDNTQYSGVMVTVSGIMLARTAKSDWESLLNNRLLEPLNMQGSTLGLPRNA